MRALHRCSVGREGRAVAGALEPVRGRLPRDVAPLVGARQVDDPERGAVMEREGFTFLRFDSGYAVFDASAGRYEFISR